MKEIKIIIEFRVSDGLLKNIIKLLRANIVRRKEVFLGNFKFCFSFVNDKNILYLLQQEFESVQQNNKNKEHI